MTPITRLSHWLTVGIIAVIAGAVRLAAIHQPIRYDEAISWAYYVGRSWNTIVTTYAYPNNHVLHSLLAKLVAEHFKYQPWALRIPAFIAGVAIIPLMVSIGRRFADLRSGLLAAALAAGSMELALFSTNARGYSLIVACFLAQLVIAHDLREHRTTKGFVLFAVLGALGLYTIPTMLYPLGVATVWLLLSARTMGAERRSFATWALLSAVAAVALAAMLYAPIISNEGLAALTDNKFVAPSTWSRFGRDLKPMFGLVLSEWTSPLPHVVGYVMLGLAAIGMVMRRGRTGPSLALAAALWCLPLLAVTHHVPFVRVWIFLLPLFLLAVACGVWWCVDLVARHPVAVPQWTHIAIAGAMAAILASTHAIEKATDTGLYPNGPAVSLLIGPQLRPGDRILAPMPATGPLLYYITRAGFDSTAMSRTFADTRRAFLVLDTERGHTLQWAFSQRVLTTEYFNPSELIGQFGAIQVWRTDRKNQ